MRSVRAWLLRALARLSNRRVGVVLVYHRLAEQAGDRRREISPPTAVAAFEQGLAHLRRCYRVVPPREIEAAAAARRRGGRFPVAVTLDDDLSSHLALAAPALERAGVPAAFFLCGATLDGPAPMWWDDLQAALDAGRVTALEHVDQTLVGAAVAGEDRAAARLAGAIEKLTPADRQEVAARLRTLAGEAPVEAGLREADVQVLAEKGFEIGFHTVHHDLLPTLPDAGVEAALLIGRERLFAPTLLAYPHGKAGPREADAARRAGYERAFTGSAQPVVPGVDPMLTPRLEAAQDPADLAGQLARIFMRGNQSASRRRGGATAGGSDAT